MYYWKVRLILDDVHLISQFFGFPEIIGIKKCYIFTGRKFDALISCRSGAFIFLAMVLYMAGIRLDCVGCVIGGSVINNNDFEIIASLVENRLDGIL